MREPPDVRGFTENRVQEDNRELSRQRRKQVTRVRRSSGPQGAEAGPGLQQGSVGRTQNSGTRAGEGQPDP